MITTSLRDIECGNALGWYVIFGHHSQMEVMRAFYETVLELPLYLNWRRSEGRIEDKDHFWAGEAVILDINYDGTQASAPPRQAAVFRAHGLDKVTARIRNRGGDVTEISDGPHGRSAFVTDPMGQLIGLRETTADAMLPADVEARRRFVRGEAFNPGCKPMPAGWQELGWVQLRAADPERLAQFYLDAFGLAEIDRRSGSLLLDLGDHIALEIVPGGVARPDPPEQMAATATFILRTQSLARLYESAIAFGSRLIGKHYTSARGEWLYLADPEGNIIGLCEWKHPAAYCENLPVVALDIEARRRAIEAGAMARASPRAGRSGQR